MTQHHTTAEIRQAIRELHAKGAFDRAGRYFSESPDSVRIAFQWLDAQLTRKTPAQWFHLPLKHVIESWAGRYVSTHDVITAAHLHPRIVGRYPAFNLSHHLTLPSVQRLEGIGEAFTHRQYLGSYAPSYSRAERIEVAA